MAFSPSPALRQFYFFFYFFQIRLGTYRSTSSDFVCRDLPKCAIVFWQRGPPHQNTLISAAAIGYKCWSNSGFPAGLDDWSFDQLLLNRQRYSPTENRPVPADPAESQYVCPRIWVSVAQFYSPSSKSSSSSALRSGGMGGSSSSTSHPDDRDATHLLGGKNRIYTALCWLQSRRGVDSARGPQQDWPPANWGAAADRSQWTIVSPR